MRLLATIRPETRDPERYQCLRCGIWRVKKSGRSTRYCWKRLRAMQEIAQQIVDGEG